MAESRTIFNPRNTPVLESADGTMRNCIMVTPDNCGAQQTSAGQFYLAPGHRTGAIYYADLEEVLYVISGRGLIVVDDQSQEMGTGDVVFIPQDRTHYAINTGQEPLHLLWTLPRGWSAVTGVNDSFADWRRVDPTSPMQPKP